MIEIKDLNININSEFTLNNCDIKINDGEILGITGPAVCGKTALMNVFSRKIKFKPTSYLINNLPARIFPKSYFSVQSEISEIPLIDTVEDFLDLSSFLAIKFNGETINDNKTYFLKKSGLDKKLKTPLYKLSNSELKLALIIFTLLQESNIYLFDNPQTFLDQKQTDLIIEFFRKLMFSGEKNIIAASTDINFLLSTADRIVVMKNGKICGEITPNEIDEELLSEIYGQKILLIKNIYNGNPVILFS